MLKDSLAQLDALPVLERDVLCALSVIHTPLARSVLADRMKMLGLKDGGRVLVSTRLTPVFEAFETRNWLVSTRDGLVLAPALAHVVLAQMALAGTLRPLAEIVGRALPRKSAHYLMRRDESARDIRLHAHLGEHDHIAEICADFEKAQGRYESTGQLLLNALSPEVPLALLEALKPELAAALVAEIVNVCSAELSHLEPAVSSWLAQAGEGPLQETRAHAGMLSALCGDVIEALRLAGDASHEDTLALRSFTALVADELVSARTLAAESIELTLGPKRKKRGGVSGWAGPWLALVLASSERASDRELAEVQLSAAERQRKAYGYADIYAQIRTLLQPTEPGSEATPAAPSPVSESEGWDALLLGALLRRFAEHDHAPNDLRDLAALEQRARMRGFVWLAEQARYVVDKNEARGLCNLHRMLPRWERSLLAIEQASGVEALEAAPSMRERLVWVVSQAEGELELSARLQTQQQQGFSAGRSISLRRLSETPKDADFLCDQDRSVLSAIRLERDPYFGGSRHRLEPEAAFTRLIGHPRVFLADEGLSALEVVHGAPRIDISEDAHALRVQVVPAACAVRKVAVELEGQRLVVYAQSDAQFAVARNLSGKGLSVPVAARARLERTLAQVASVLPVGADASLGSDLLSEVESDSVLRVLLARSADGVKARLFVQPLTHGLTFFPGKGSPAIIGRVGIGNEAQRVRATRNLTRELELLDALIAAAPTLEPVLRTGEYLYGELSHALQLLSELANTGDDIVRVAWSPGDTLTVLGQRGVRDVRLRVTTAEDWLEVQGDVQVDTGLRLELRELLAHTARRKGRFIELDAGRFVSLSDDLMKQLDQLEAMTTEHDGRYELHPLALTMLDSFSAELASFERDAEVDERIARIQTAQALQVELPAAFEAELRPYQRDGFEWLCRLTHWGAGACLADDMGLGKTLQTLALLVRESENGPALVVAPTSVLSNWVDEIRKFAPTLRSISLGGEGREQVISALGPGDVLITSYGLVQQAVDLLSARKFRVVVVDEAQAIKNAAAQRTKAVMALSGDIRIALTGTPIENHLGELWSIMTFVNPGLLGSTRAFEERFAKPIQRDSDREAAHNLKRLVHPFVLRRKKAEVLDELPEKTVVTLRVEPSAEERALYAALRDNALAKSFDPNKPNAARIQLLAELMRMRRAACHPSLVAPDARIQSTKLEAFEALLDELREGGHRALVFSQFVDYLALVRARLDERSIPYQYLDGSSSQSQRASSVKAFQRGEGDAFLISLKAGGFGLNLTAADYVVHLDPWWNPAVEDQATDRAHRIGQTRPVTVYRLVMKDSIEERILALHDDKRELADRLLEGTNMASKLSVDDLMSLLRDQDPLLDAVNAARRSARSSAPGG